MIKVKNLTTGIVHTVPVGHFSLSDVGYEVVKEEVIKEEAQEVIKPVESNRKRKTRG